jgi:hypothetical protein
MREAFNKAIDEHQQRVDEIYNRVREIRRPLKDRTMQKLGWMMWFAGALVGFAVGWFGCMLLNGVPL